MTTAQTISLRTFTDLAPARDDLIAVYSDVRAELLHLPNYAVPAFTERLDRHGGDPGWFAVLAYTEAGEPIGYVYGNVIESDDRWWKRIKPNPPAQYTDRPAIAVKELGVRVPWRKTGTAKRLHDTLLAAHTAQPYATLMVNPAAGDGKVQRLYESWGYWSIGVSHPSPDSPILTAMIRPTGEGAA
ncbi:GNAT family N-acetyltransferase [Streptomyces mexicanus]|uniref:GNAT family N-acetyltransferase n=1 Tax=Streptomyces mexicanus TaxID=178566 RepID=A0A7X1HWR0_9ACTN|nr:GNAT family N-acetyltransferase [Streptomyces mexicanus]MBC2864451.1 GNAT family N-acetyltransferase [Streptomyces mexicanus]